MGHWKGNANSCNFSGGRWENKTKDVRKARLGAAGVNGKAGRRGEAARKSKGQFVSKGTDTNNLLVRARF